MTTPETAWVVCEATIPVVVCLTESSMLAALRHTDPARTTCFSVPLKGLPPASRAS